MNYWMHLAQDFFTRSPNWWRWTKLRIVMSLFTVIHGMPTPGDQHLPTTSTKVAGGKRITAPMLVLVVKQHPPGR